MKKKLVSLFCAVAMSVSAFGAFTVASADENATPEVPNRLESPVATPTPEAPAVTTGARIGGTAEVKDGNAVITISYDGLTSVSMVQFDVPLNTDIFNVEGFVAKNATTFPGKITNPQTLNYSTKSDAIKFVWSPADTTDTSLYGGASETVAVITVPLKADVTYPLNIELTGAKMADNVNGNQVNYKADSEDSATKLAVNKIKIEDPTINQNPTVKAAKDVFNKNAATEIGNVAEGKTAYMTVTVKDSTGNTVPYGKKGFTAVYNNTELTEEAFKNLINGYGLGGNESAIDLGTVVEGLSFKFYSTDVASVSSTICSVDADGSNAAVVVPETDKTTGTYTAPTVTVAQVTKTVYTTDASTDIKATVANVKDGASVKFTITSGTDVASFVEPVADENGTETQADDDSATVKTVTLSGTTATVKVYLSATAKTSFKVKAEYAYTDEDNAAATATSNELNVDVKVKSTSGSSTDNGGNDNSGNNNYTSSNNGGGGATIIANGNVGVSGTPTNTQVNTYKPSFNDLNSVSWAAEAINGLASRGMISGRDQYTFDPNANITRAEYCQILMGAINTLNAKGTSTFNDVSESDWYYNAVSVASQLGIVSGYGDGNFGPNELISRQDMAVMTYRTAKNIMNKSLEPVNAGVTFADSNAIADYAFEAVMTLQKAGIINGVTDTEFAPLANATRAQAAKIIYDTFVK